MAQFGRYSSSNPLRNLPGQVMGLMDFMEKKKGREGELDISERRVGVSEGHLKLAEAKQQAEIHVAEKPFTSGETAMMRAMGENFNKKYKFRLNTLGPIADKIDEWTKRGYMKKDVHGALKKDWENTVKPALKNIEDAMVKAQGSLEDRPTTEAQEKVKELTQMHTELSNPNFVDKMMPATTDYLKKKAMPKVPKSINEALARKYKDDPDKLEKLFTGKAKKERLYPTTEGYQPREEAIGKLKPKTEKSSQPKPYVTWQLPDGTTKNLRSGVTPPEGAVKYKDTRMLTKDIAKFESEIIEANTNKASMKAAQPKIDAFNSMSTKPYYYIYNTGKKEYFFQNWVGHSDDVIVKVPLPKIDGRQATAKDLFATAKIHTGGSIPKMIEKLLKEGKIKKPSRKK